MRVPSPTAQALILAGVLVVTALVYGSQLGHEFQFDDRWKILQQWRILEPAQYMERFGDGIYRPAASRLIPNITISINHALGGVDPWGYHLVSLVFHLINVVLVFLFVRALYHWAGEEDEGVALLSAALFAVHPLNSEAVTYTNARPNLIVCTFYLGALIAMLYIFTSAATGWRRYASIGGAGLLVGLALLSKEQAVTLAATAPLLLAWIDGGWNVQRELALRALKTGPVMVVAAVAVEISTGAVYEVHRAVVTTGTAVAGHWFTYLLLTVIGQSEVFIGYLLLALLPLPQLLNVDRRPMGHLHQHLFDNGQLVDGALSAVWLPLLSFGLLLVTVRLLFAWRARAPIMTFCGLWIFITHSPTSVVPRGEVMVEYRTYLPMVGVCVLLAAGLRMLLERSEAYRQRPLMPLGVLVALLATGSAVRVQAWETEESLWQDALAKNPLNARAHDALGRIDAQAGRLDQAEVHFRDAIRLSPDFPEPRTNLGGLLAQRGDLKGAEHQLMTAARLKTEDENAYNNLGNVLSMLDKPELAVATFEQALAIRGHFPEAHANMGLALLRLDRIDEGREHLARAVEMEPQHARFRIMFARALLMAGEVEQAITQLKAAVQIDARSAQAHTELGKAYSYQGQYESAIAHLQRALELEPDNHDAATYLAQLQGQN